MLCAAAAPTPACAAPDAPAPELDPYEAALGRARRSAQAGDLASAAQLLEETAAAFPQDAQVALQLAWTRFRAGDHAAAERAYRMALERGEGSGEAQLGLAWSLQRQGRCEEARPAFARVLAMRPGDAGARQGEALCAPPRPATWRPAATLGLYLYQDHPLRGYAAAVTARVDATLRGRFLIGALYRFSHFSSNVAAVAPWQQHDVFAHGAYSRPAFALGVSYALLAAQDGSGSSHHVGVDGRWSPGGDGTLALAASFYSDLTILRGELGWRAPVYGGLSLRPAGSLQWAGGELLKSVSLTISYDHRRFHAFAGGKYGDELRPAYLAYGFVYNNLERIPWGAFAGASAPLPRGFALQLSWALDRLRGTTAASPPTPGTAPAPATQWDAGVHYLNLTLSKEL